MHRTHTTLCRQRAKVLIPFVMGIHCHCYLFTRFMNGAQRADTPKSANLIGFISAGVAEMLKTPICWLLFFFLYCILLLSTMHYTISSFIRFTFIFGLPEYSTGSLEERARRTPFSSACTSPGHCFPGFHTMPVDESQRCHG